MKFEEVLGEVLAETGLPVAGQSDGQGFSLLFDNEHEVEFEPDAEDGSVVFHAEVGDADRLGDAALRALFEASLLGANTDGAAFSIEPRFSKVVLWKRCHEFSSAAALRHELEAFLGQMIHWKKRLADGFGEIATTERTEPLGTFQGGFLQV